MEALVGWDAPVCVRWRTELKAERSHVLLHWCAGDPAQCSFGRTDGSGFTEHVHRVCVCACAPCAITHSVHSVFNIPVRKNS